mmetsp:Transcript_1772/g.4248  ORF Transcript_1772/g.4248 Transcript_1772/m.4248 type:complete len:116 (+) Transcript_1772:472-819(+)|eukprot:CAMPEP_0201259678 /NCGR_PEP_ID=MMETSP0853-20130426/3996_1 /ASSEMBLY_ACC=CAM_ASM_000640 /TAXON_ID=183588 /ORGANISM="Pseudo-nitzschia fraudulenta, Strain WWA7" /LENGTH=115 /DNA_ID=CAMNT_0047561941 /DNA_START=406 /DNA_END=753 /DNA_ORIENTATION=-
MKRTNVVFFVFLRFVFKGRLLDGSWLIQVLPHLLWQHTNSGTSIVEQWITTTCYGMRIDDVSASMKTKPVLEEGALLLLCFLVPGTDGGRYWMSKCVSTRKWDRQRPESSPSMED